MPAGARCLPGFWHGLSGPLTGPDAAGFSRVQMAASLGLGLGEVAAAGQKLEGGEEGSLVGSESESDPRVSLLGLFAELCGYLFACFI